MWDEAEKALVSARKREGLGAENLAWIDRWWTERQTLWGERDMGAEQVEGEGQVGLWSEVTWGQAWRDSCQLGAGRWVPFPPACQYLYCSELQSQFCKGHGAGGE